MKLASKSLKKGSFICSCKTGHFGTGRDCIPGQCHDGICPENQVCISQTHLGCECKPGYSKNGSSDFCDDIDECSEESPCGNNSECSNFPGSYKCSCHPGFVGDGTNCLKGQCIDEGFCQKNEKCVSLTSTECTCKSGFDRDSDGNCVDIDECESNVVSCPSTSTCKNTIGSYTCNCDTGYGGRSCDDINECIQKTHQ